MACCCGDWYVHEDFLNLPLRCFLVTMSEDERPTSPPAKKRLVLKKTADKRIAENDREMNMSIWLKYNVPIRDSVRTRRCSVCYEFHKRLVSMRNYRPRFVEGTSNIRALFQRPCSNGHELQEYEFGSKEAVHSRPAVCPHRKDHL